VIRGWFRRRRPTVGVPLDTTVFIGAQLDVRDAQIEGLRDALAEALRQLADRDRQIAQLQVAGATALTMQWLQRGAANQARLDGPTTVLSSEQFQRTRPASPTERWTR
jgi:hypothetical protein